MPLEKFSFNSFLEGLVADVILGFHMHLSPLIFKKFWSGGIHLLDNFQKVLKERIDWNPVHLLKFERIANNYPLSMSCALNPTLSSKRVSSQVLPWVNFKMNIKMELLQLTGKTCSIA